MTKFAVLLLILLAALPASAQDDGLITQTLQFDGVERASALHVPDALPDEAPLVLVLHARFGDGPGMAEHTGFNAIADREGFLVAYPDGIDGEWNYIRGVTGYPNPLDDVAFLTTLVDTIAAGYPVDRTRVYVAGFSNGGFMTQRIACEAPGPFAAFASVAASGFGGMLAVCIEPETAPAPMLLIHGTADDNVPWEGNGVTRGEVTVYVTYPVPETLAYWAEFNGCQPNAETENVPQSGRSPGTSVRFLRVDCPANASVVLAIVEGGGHNWPGPDQEPYPGSGLINHDIDAAEEIWSFFADHALEVTN